MNTLPLNLEAERRCLSALMKSDRDAIDAFASGLRAEHFSDAKNRLIFAAITSCVAQKLAPEPAALLSALSSLHGKTAVGVQTLIELESLEPTSVNRAKLVERVLDLAKQRIAITELQLALDAAQNDGDSWNGISDRVIPHIRAVLDCSNDSRSPTLDDFVLEACESLTTTANTGVDGPFPKWDEAAGRMKSGQLTVLAGRPGTGKTALALQYAANVAAKGHTVVIFSLEMTGSELSLRIASQDAGRNGVGSHPDAKAALHAALKAVPKRYQSLHVYEAKAANTLDQIEARSRLHSSDARGLALVVIDYLQLITPPPEARREHRERQVAETSRRLKLLAQDLKCPILLLAQLNRASEQEERRPRMHDLRESGAIEQDADRIWMLYAPPPSNSEPLYSDHEKAKVELIQAKARNGPPWVITELIFERPCVKFAPAA